MLLSYVNSGTIKIVKITFFTAFFKNFLTWNYILTTSKLGDFTNNYTNSPTLTLQNRSYNDGVTHISNVNTNYSLNSFYKIAQLINTFYWAKIFLQVKIIVYKSFSFSWYYLNGFIFILFIDACLTDDEPLWEPIEWSLVQTWILFIFSFAWIAENLIVSRYGSYAGRDKRVWMAWYKTFWLIEGYYVLNYGVAVVLVMVPFYFEVNYNLSFVYSWWNWFSKVFFL
jgi:hypothetical protein